MGLRRFGRIEHHLHGAPAVAQVDEDQTTVVPPPSDPPVELELSPDVSRAERAAMWCVEAAHASLARRSSHATAVCSPLSISFSCTVRCFASSALSSTTHLAPSLLADRIFAFRLLAS